MLGAVGRGKAVHLETTAVSRADIPSLWYRRFTGFLNKDLCQASSIVGMLGWGRISFDLLALMPRRLSLSKTTCDRCRRKKE
jgi:hypothetical protein